MKVGLSQMSLRARETLKHSALLLYYIYYVSLPAPRARSDICDIAPIASVAGGQQCPRHVLQDRAGGDVRVKSSSRCST